MGLPIVLRAFIPVIRSGITGQQRRCRINERTTTAAAQAFNSLFRIGRPTDGGGGHVAEDRPQFEDLDPAKHRLSSPVNEPSAPHGFHVCNAKTKLEFYTDATDLVRAISPSFLDHP